ncbi:MAG: hypothetical protein ACRYGA_07890 [Janthinobacterium lividum]
MADEVEYIPSDHLVSRHIDLPYRYTKDKDLIWEAVFMFKDNKGESLVWRKYKPTIEEVHDLGCSQEARKKPQKPDYRYVGAITALVQDIRNEVSGRGATFRVEHHPENDQGVYHAEIWPCPKEGAQLKSNDRADLRVMLKNRFKPREEHACSPAKG